MYIYNSTNMDDVFYPVLFRVIYALICCVINFLAVEGSRIIRGVKCRPGEYYSVPAESCISCHVPCDNAIIKKSQDICNTFCPDFAKPTEHIPDRITGSVQSDLSWVAVPVVAVVLTLILVVGLLIYCRKHSRFFIGKQFRGSRGQRNVADPVHDEELQTLDTQHGPESHPGNPTAGSAILEGRRMVSVHCLPENPHYPLEFINVPHIPEDVNISQHNPDYPTRILYPFAKSQSLQDHPTHYRVQEEEPDTTLMKPAGQSQASMSPEVPSSEPLSLQNNNNYIIQSYCSMDENVRVVELQENLVRAEVSKSIPHSSSPNSRSQVCYNGNMPSINEHYQYEPNFIGMTSNAYHAAVMENNVYAYHEFLASPNIACLPVPLRTLISIPVIVEQPEGDPDNLEWQEQQHRAAQDKRCLHHPGSGKDQYVGKECSMDLQKALVPNL